MSEQDVLTAIEHLRMAAYALKADPALFFEFSLTVRKDSLVLEQAVEDAIAELAIRRNQRT